VKTLENYRRTTYAVWEITLACNLACSHCGSRAGPARPDELTTAEALDLVAQMREVGINEVSLIGGEAFLRSDWLEIAAAIDRAGMVCTMTTGGYGISLETARRMKAAGIARLSVSVDGLEATHDDLRGKPGSFEQCFKTMRHLREVGIPFGINTQVNRRSAPEIPELYLAIREAGAIAWQLQLTVPMGNAADNWRILLQPEELLPLYDMLAVVARRANREGVEITPGNNIGYFGPYERLLRGKGEAWAFWTGCQAGLYTLGIEANGAIKGCPSLPTAAYTGGNIRERRLRDIVLNAPELTFNLGAGTPEGTKHLWGFCAGCEHRELCRGGCSWTAHVFFDRRGNNPYCHHRALSQAARGVRERVYPKLKAIGKPFDNGVFELVEEPLDAPWPADDELRFTWEKVRWPAAFGDENGNGNERK
jgi:nif11-class peptide radical SAM maturase 3